MLDKSDFKKIKKPFIAVLISKTLFFIGLLILITSTNNNGFNNSNITISSCQNYLNYKYSNYYNAIKQTYFIFSILGTVFSCFQMSIYLFFVVLNKINKSEIINQQQKFTQSRLKLQFVLNFIQLFIVSNIFARSIENAIESYSCPAIPSTKNSVLIALSTITFLCSLLNTFILFKIRKMIRNKSKNQNYLNQFSQYVQSSSMRANLLYNKEGYMKDLLNLQNYSSKTTLLRQQTVKHFPSGIKKNNNLTTSQIVYRLRGGSKTLNLIPQKLDDPKNKIIEQQQDFDVQFQKFAKNHDNLQKAFNLWPKIQNFPAENRSQQDKQNLLELDDKMYLKVNPPKYQLNPNNDDMQSVQTTLNVLSFCFNNTKKKKNKKKQGQKDQTKDNQDLQSQAEDKSKKLYQDKPQISKNKLAQKKKLTNDKIRTRSKSQFNQQILKANYNLAPESQARRKMAMQRNYQNIDQNGKYYFVDLKTIEKKDKTFAKAVQDEFSGSKNQQDPNVKYSRKQWNPKQKRRPKQHNKKIQKRLIQKQKKIKQQIQFYRNSSSSSYQSSSQQNSSDQSQQNQQNSVIPQKQILNQNGQKMSPQQIQEYKKKKMAQKLFLHMKRKKLTGIQHKYKLYQDEEGFYDEPSQEISQAQDENLTEAQRLLRNNKKNKQNQQKGKGDHKIDLRNKQLQTEQYNMLRFIRSKYVQSHYQQQQDQNYTYTLYEEQGQDEEYTENQEGEYQEEYQEGQEQEYEQEKEQGEYVKDEEYEQQEQQVSGTSRK